MTYKGPSTLNSALSGAPKTDKNGRYLTVIQRLCGKYGINEGQGIYKHFQVRQKKASKRGRQVQGTKSGPRRISEGKVGGHGRSQIYQDGDRTGSWTKSGGITRKGANRGKGWYQERGYGTPAVGPLPDTEEGRKVYGESAGKMTKAGFPSGYTFVPSQVRERKKRSDN